MSLLDQEIKFLKAFKKRFTTNKTYKAAVDDMMEAGMITTRAYNYIVNEFIPSGKGTPVAPTAVAKQVAQHLKESMKAAEEHKKKINYDPCSRSSC